MDVSNGPSLVLPSRDQTKPKLRRKLQKVKRPGSGAATNEAPSYSTTNNNKLDTAGKPCLPLPPDLSDSKWSEYLRSSGYLCATLDSLPPPATATLKPPISIIPELSHLSQNNDTPRSSVDTIASGSTAASAASLRRRAKTPVHHIGDLEARARARKAASANLEAAKAWKKTMTEDGRKQGRVEDGQRMAGADTTVKDTRSTEVDIDCGSELIAEQYKALLAPGESMFTDSHSEPPQSRQEEREGLTVRRQRSSGDLRRDSQIFQPAAGLESPQGSPTSDGTLVAFEEETVYFKPVSFSPEPSSPIHNYESPLNSPLPTPNNIGLKICVDLLANDLNSATSLRAGTAGEASALQIWTMIEAYERLRERIAECGLRYDEILSMEQTFDTWLKALYKVHDRLVGGDLSGSEYSDLERTTAVLGLD